MRIDVVLGEKNHALGCRVAGLTDLNREFPYFPVERVFAFLHSELQVGQQPVESVETRRRVELLLEILQFLILVLHFLVLESLELFELLPSYVSLQILVHVVKFFLL
jgi:hypothetical protein